jgi:ribosomal protein S18 acetylase RimI-like enzyme
MEAGATPSATDSLEEVRRLIAAPQAALLVALHDGRIVGSVIAGWDGWRGNIYRLTVAPDFRRRGVARALMRAADDLLRRAGAKRISALVEREHPWAVAFWDALVDAGYRRDERMLRYVRTLIDP